MTSTPPTYTITSVGRRFSAVQQDVIAIVLICLIGYLLHRSALDGYWRADDGDHLLFAVKHRSWEYFVDPQAIVGHSGAHVTPWNPFFYNINLALFGWKPSLHYLHLLSLIVAGSLVTYALLRQALTPTFSFFGAMAFAAGGPTYSVGQHLMTGHYATGLVFAALALLSFLRRDLACGRWLGPLFYALACLCKEVFVPLVGILWLIPQARSKLSQLAPYVAVAAGYFALRWLSLGSVVGGYGIHGATGWDRVHQMLNIPALLWGKDVIGVVVTACAGLVILSLVVFSPRSRWVVAGGTVLTLGPLVPLTTFPGINAADRYLFVVWWAICVAMAFGLNALARRGGGRYLAMLASLLLASGSWVQYVTVRDSVDAQSALFDALFKAVTHQQPNEYLVPPDFAVGYLHETLTNADRAYRLHSHSDQAPARVIPNHEEALTRLPLDALVSEYDASCRCVATTEGRLDILRAKGQLAKQSFRTNVPLALRIKYENGRVSWAFEKDGNKSGYFLFVDGDSRKFNIGESGVMGYPKSRKMDFRMEYVSSEGWRATTPLMHLDPIDTPSVEWRGMSVIPEP